MRKSSLWVLNFSTDATSQQMKEQLTGYEVVINTTSGGDIAKAYHSNGDQIIILDHGRIIEQGTHVMTRTRYLSYFKTGRIVVTVGTGC